MSARLSTREVIERFLKVHGDRYDYSKTVYTDKRTKVAIGCRVHGLFHQSVAHHTQGKGCPECGFLSRIEKTRKTSETFVNQAIKVHGFRYNYRRVDYKTAKIPVSIVCAKHGVFKQSPNNHLLGQGCKKCATELVAVHSSISQSEFVRACRRTHGTDYSYKKTKYSGDHKKIVITCKLHGDFVQDAGRHKRGSGCPSCGYSGFDPLKPATFYVLVTDSFIGYGISNYPKQRLSSHRRTLKLHGVKILSCFEFLFSSGYEAQGLERSIKRKVKARASVSISGFKTEAVKVKHLDKLLTLVKRRHECQNTDC